MTNTTTPEQGLRACPYGCEPTNPPYVMTDDTPRHYVRCDSCGAQGPRCQTKRQATAFWNTRSTPLDNELVDAKALLDELLDGPSKGAFYGIGEVLRGKLETIRLTLTSSLTKPVCLEGLDDEAVVERVARALREVAMRRAYAEHGAGKMAPWEAWTDDARAALAALVSPITSDISRG